MKKTLDHNKKMLGKKVLVEDKDYSFSGIVDKIVDSQTFLIKDCFTGETKEVNIFDNRSL